MDRVDESNLKKLKTFSFELFDMPLSVLTSIIEDSKSIKKRGAKKPRIINTPDLLSMMGFTHHLVWIAPLRSKPKRTYDQIKLAFNPEGDHTPYLIRKMLEDEFSDIAKDFHSFIQGFGKESGLFKDIEINSFGTHPASPFELRVVNEGKSLNVCNLGYGVSQSLPILVELFTRPKYSWFAIQQPEVHLHPRAQAALGEVFFDLAMKEKMIFFIETHSDFMVDRFRLKVNSTKKTVESQVVFFEQKDSLNKAYPIKILPNGRYQDNLPESFGSFFIKEEISILGIR